MKRQDYYFDKITDLISKPWFAVIWFGIAILSYFFADKPIAVFMEQHYEATPLLFIAHLVTNFGITSYYIIFFGFSLLFAKIFWKNKNAMKIIWFFFLVILVSGVTCDIIKIILSRARPTEWFHHQLYGFYFFNFKTSNMWSFPSGHATVITSIMVSASLLWKRFWPIFMLIILLVSFSRLVLTAHYLSDIMAGMYLGAIISITIYRIMYTYERETN